MNIVKKKSKNHNSDERQENPMSEGRAVGMCLGRTVVGSRKRWGKYRRAIVVGLAAASTGLIARLAVFLAGAGALTSVAVTALYNPVKPLREAVD